MSPRLPKCCVGRSGECGPFEYTGNLGQAILERPNITEYRELNELIAEGGIALLGAFGFSTDD